MCANLRPELHRNDAADQTDKRERKIENDRMLPADDNGYRQKNKCNRRR